jgi:hypothetical protein
VPLSADGVDASLLLYDVCRPFSMLVEGTTISDRRWVGLPQQVDLSQIAVGEGIRTIAPDFSSLQGEHYIPSVLPDALRSDRGSIFTSVHVRAVARSGDRSSFRPWGKTN